MAYLRGLPGMDFITMQKQINELYHHDCCHAELAEASNENGLGKLIEQLIDDIFKTQQMPNNDCSKQTTAAIAEHLWEGILQGYGTTLQEVDFDTPDHAMLRNLQQNAYVFSAAKAFQMAKSITQSLIDSQGGIRSFNDFKFYANQVTGQHMRWLKTEYNTAIASAQMAAKWTKIQKEKQIFPLLQFDAVLDKKTTKLCKDFDRITLPVDHHFWAQFYPPNHWGCRSTVRQLPTGTPTAQDKIPIGEDIPDIFKVNLAHNGWAFPTTHPYFKEVPKEVLSFGEANFVKQEFRTGKGQVYESGMSINPFKKRDIRALKELDAKRNVADALANHFNKDVFILPELPNPSKDWRYPYFHNLYNGAFKQPDYKFQDLAWEMESHEKKFKISKINDMLQKGLEQSANIVLKINNKVDLQRLTLKIRGRKEYDQCNKIVLVTNQYDIIEIK